MANIRKKFKGQFDALRCSLAERRLIGYRLDGSLDGYQKKKYEMKCSRLWHPVLSDFMKQIRGQDHLHVYPWVQGRRWTHGSR